MPADYGKMLTEETHDEGKLLVEESQLRSTHRSSGSYARYGSVYKNETEGAAGLLREPGAPAQSSGGGIRRISKSSQQRIQKRLAQARRHLKGDAAATDASAPQEGAPGTTGQNIGSALAGAAGMLVGTMNATEDDDETMAQAPQGAASAQVAARRIKAKRAAKATGKAAGAAAGSAGRAGIGAPPAAGASTAGAAQAAGGTAASSAQATTAVAVSTSTAKAAGHAAAATSGVNAATDFARKELDRHTKRAAWRESTRRANAAKQAINGAAKTSGASKAALEAAARAEGAAVSAGASSGASMAAAAGAAAIAIIMVLMTIGITVAVIETILHKQKPLSSNTALAAWAISEYELGQDEDYWAGGERYWSACGYDQRVEWCSCFVMTGWTECGFTESMGSPPGFAAANSWISWAKDDTSKGELIKCDKTWSPKPGDICVDGEPHGASNHVGICCSEVDERGQYRMIAGNEGDQVAERWLLPGQEWTWIFRPAYPDVEGDVEFGEDEQAFIDEWAPRIDDWFKSWASDAPLAGHGEDFAKAAYEYKVDPRWSPGISRIESTGGKYCFASHNAWGWGSSSWSSWEEAIDAHTKGLAEGYAGMSIDSMAAKYCPPNAESWASQLKQYTSEI